MRLLKNPTIVTQMRAVLVSAGGRGELCEVMRAARLGCSVTFSRRNGYRPTIPLRAVRRLLNEALKGMTDVFDRMYVRSGRPSIPPEQLLRALLLQVLYSVRSERLADGAAGLQPAVSVVRGAVDGRYGVASDDLHEEPGSAAQL